MTMIVGNRLTQNCWMVEIVLNHAEQEMQTSGGIQ